MNRTDANDLWTRRAVLRRSTSTVVGLAAATFGAGSAASGAQVEKRKVAKVSLAFDPATQRLLKAQGRELHAYTSGGAWQRAELELTTRQASIASITVAAGTQGATYVAAPGAGVLRSAAGLRDFSARNKGLPSTAVTAVAAHAEQPETLYAYLPKSGIYRSDNAGEAWRLMDVGPPGDIAQLIHSNMPGSMQTGWLFAAARNGVQRSMDCFCGWRNAGEFARAVSAVTYEPDQPSRIHAARGASLMSSDDGGETWKAAPGPAVAITALAASPSGILYAAAASGAVFRRARTLAAWERLNA